VVLSVDWSHSGKLIVSGSYDGAARVWRAISGEQVSVPRGHTLAVRSIGVLLTGRPDRIIATTASYDGTAWLHVWNRESGEQIHVLNGHGDRSVYLGSFSPDGAVVVTAGDDGTARVRSVRGVRRLQ